MHVRVRRTTRSAALALLAVLAAGVRADDAPVQELQASPPVISQRFGTGLAVNGRHLIVGSPGGVAQNQRCGVAHAFTLVDNAWVEDANRIVPDDPTSAQALGTALALSGDTLLCGAPESSYDFDRAGAGVVFVRGAGGWTEQGILLADDAESLTFLGDAVALDGDTAIVGAPRRDESNLELADTGAAYVFTRQNGTWTLQDKLQSPNIAEFKFFGISVGVSGDTAIVGDFLHNSSQGGGQIFNRTNGTWTYDTKLVGDDAGSFSFLGRAVAIDGDTAVVSADADSEKAQGGGAVYVFTRSAGVWTQEQKVFPDDPQDGAQFGQSLALDGDTLLVGAPPADNDLGALYVFRRTAGVWTQECKLVAGIRVASERFAQTCAVGGEFAVGGVPARSSSTGVAYAFDLAPLAIGTTSLGGGTTGAQYSAQLQATGGVPPITWTLDSGTSPFAGGIPTDGLLVGPLDAAGSYSFTARATDSFGRTATQQLALDVADAPEFTTGTVLQPYVAGRGYYHVIRATGGATPYTFGSLDGLPAGFSLSESGVLTADAEDLASRGDVQLDIAIEDANGAIVTQGFTIPEAPLVVFPANKTKTRRELVLDSLDTSGAPAGQVAVELVAGTLLTATVSYPNASEVPVDVSLEFIGGLVQDVSAFTRTSRRALMIRKYPVPFAGRYQLVVRPHEGFTGPVTVTLQVQAPKRVTGTATLTSGSEHSLLTQFLPNSKVKLLVKAAKGESVVPDITSIREGGSTELLDPARVKHKGKKAETSVQMGDGFFLTITVIGLDGSAGDVLYSIKAKSPRGYVFTSSFEAGEGI